MKKQNGFISSSSSVSISYSTRNTPSVKKEVWTNLYVKSAREAASYDAKSFSTVGSLLTTSASSTLSWKTFASKSYQRIEYFLEAVEKLNGALSKNDETYLNLTNFTKTVASKNLYNGFVDIVITFPTYVRLAGIELFNPWINKLLNNAESENWKYLPSKFSIYKVNTEKTNDAVENISYENDIRVFTKSTETRTKFNPIRYDMIEAGENMTFLGKYEVNWQNTNSYKCFFKFNENDNVSINLNNDNTSSGTATWLCKQLVLRIFETKITTNFTKSNVMLDKIAEYIRAKETEFGTTYQNNAPTLTACRDLIGKSNISSDKNETSEFPNWKFGSKIIRSYESVSDVKFAAGLNYKLGGIQLLLSPDIFSVSEMKMYSYANKSNNKVFIGEWNKDDKQIEYYGTGLTKRSPSINITNSKAASISWKHNFNIPPKYLDAKVFIKFNIDYDNFYAGDIISNLVNINKEPLTLKLTGSEVQVNIANGICFTNPESGEFMSFMNGVGVHMDNEGNYDAYKAAKSVNANILDYGSKVGSTITGGYPFDLCFVVKRLF